MEVDATQGKESHPINGPVASACFQYVKTNIPGPHFDESQFMDEFEGCPCTDNCDELNCPCVQLFGPAYDSNKRLLETWCLDGVVQKRSIFECGDNCACKNGRCSLRVVQKGINVRMKVFETRDKGYGLQAVSGISRLSFVCEYAGEVVNEHEARRRLNRNEGKGLMNYLIAVKECTSSSKHTAYVDPCHTGNIGRFINHSCDPNLVMIPVRVNHPVPRLALFSRRDISPGEELTFDYSGSASLTQSPAAVVVEGCDAQGKMNSISYKEEVGKSKSKTESVVDGINIKSKRTKCFCGSNNCEGYLPLDEHLFD